MERKIENLTEVLDTCPKPRLAFLISLSIAAIKLMMTDDLKFLKKLAEFRILFFVVKGFAQDTPKSSSLLHNFSPVSLNCSICSLAMLYAGFPPVLGNNEITYLTSSVGQMSTASVSFSISLSIAAISDQMIYSMYFSYTVCSSRLLPTLLDILLFSLACHIPLQKSYILPHTLICKILFIHVGRRKLLILRCRRSAKLQTLRV